MSNNSEPATPAEVEKIVGAFAKDGASMGAPLPVCAKDHRTGLAASRYSRPPTHAELLEYARNTITHDGPAGSYSAQRASAWIEDLERAEKMADAAIEALNVMDVQTAPRLAAFFAAQSAIATFRERVAAAREG